VKQISNGLALTAAVMGLVASLAASAAPAHAAAPANIRCAVAKRKAAVKKLHAVDACFGKPPTTTTQPPDPACLAKAEQKFQQEFSRIEARGGCVPETGDAATATRVVDQCETSLVRALPGRCVASGAPCETSAPCCSGLCSAVIGQVAFCR